MLSSASRPQYFRGLARIAALNSTRQLKRNFASREPLLPSHIVKNPRVKANLPLLGNVSYGALASGFLFQDILLLRTVVSIAYCGIASFHALQEKPLRIPFAWSTLFACINIFFAGHIYKERFVWLTDEEEQIYQEHFVTAMEKPDYQQLIRIAKILVAEERVDVVEKGQAANLVLLVGGTAEVKVGEGMVVAVQRPGFLGESSYLRGSAATKTVSLLPGARYIVWERSVLKELLNRKASIQRGLELMIGRELSRKLGETSSLLTQTASDTKDIVTHQKNVEYEAVVLHYALQLLADEKLLDASDCRRFFTMLTDYRQREAITDQVHTDVMTHFGMDEAACIEREISLREVCFRMAKAPLLCSRDGQLRSFRKALSRRKTMMTM